MRGSDRRAAMIVDRSALIIGVGGQDGAYLARHLVALGYRVAGTTRQKTGIPSNLSRLNIAQDISLFSLDVTDRDALRHILQATTPREVYYLAAQSSVGRSFEVPSDSMSAALGFALLLEETRGSDIRVLHAGSGDCFGESTVASAITEETSFAPRSPYAVAKVAEAHLARAAREGGQFVATAFLFNHESPLRDARFVTAKIVAAAKAIASGSADSVAFGDIDVVRDWGWAPDYVEAMHLMLLPDQPEDFVIATGRSILLRDFIARIFAAAGLDWTRHVTSDPAAIRLSDVRSHFADPAKARRMLGWNASHDIDWIATQLVRG